MVKEFTTFGSCSSRNIFASRTNNNYKKFFHINYSIESVSLISLMSKPIDYDMNLLNSSHEYDNFCVENDLSKKYLEIIKETDIDYLVFDTYFDVYSDIIILDKNTYITNSDRLIKTEFYNLVETNKKINIFENFETYFSLWKNSCDKFFKFLNKHLKNSKIILNCSRPVYNYLNGKIMATCMELFEIINPKHIKYRNILDKYIMDNYDIEILPFDYTTLASLEHVWGLHPTHYEPKFYKDKTHELNNIILRNDILNYDNEINISFRRLKCKNEIFKFYNSETNMG